MNDPSLLQWWVDELKSKSAKLLNWSELQALIASVPVPKITVKSCIVMTNRQKNRPPGMIFVLNPDKDVRDDLGNVLFVRKAGWGEPGGTKVENETMHESAKSEIKEEIDLDVAEPTDQDFICAIQTTPDHITVYFNVAPPKTGRLSVENDRMFTEYSVKEWRIVTFEELDELMKMKNVGQKPTLNDKHRNPVRIFYDDLAIAWLHKDAFLTKTT